LGEDNARGGGPRNDTEDHGKGDEVVLVLSAAVLVIVIDARDVWRAGMARAGLNTKLTEITKVFGGG
jgi:hypothetical protein